MPIYFYTTADAYVCFSNLSRHGFELSGRYVSVRWIAGGELHGIVSVREHMSDVSCALISITLLSWGAANDRAVLH